ncbi:MAG: DUF2169 domain-containing protein [Myxococcales bacterium]|nr:DUF2169 domain-containing protein [Myxococcales bacterium]
MGSVGVVCTPAVCASALPWRAGERLRVTVVVKATFALVPGGEMRALPPEPIAGADRPRPLRARHEVPGDLAPDRPRCDVTLAATRPVRGAPSFGGGAARICLRRGAEVLFDRTLGAAGTAEPTLVDEVDLLCGGEWLVLEGIHPSERRLCTRVPEGRALARVRAPGEAVAPVALVVDTLAIDADRGVCSVLWRGQHEVAGDDGALGALAFEATFAEPGAAVAWPESSEDKRQRWEQTILMRFASLPVVGEKTLELPPEPPGRADAAPASPARARAFDAVRSLPPRPSPWVPPASHAPVPVPDEATVALDGGTPGCASTQELPAAVALAAALRPVAPFPLGPAEPAAQPSATRAGTPWDRLPLPATAVPPSGEPERFARPAVVARPAFVARPASVGDEVPPSDPSAAEAPRDDAPASEAPDVGAASPAPSPVRPPPAAPARRLTAEAIAGRLAKLRVGEASMNLLLQALKSPADDDDAD